MRKVRGFIAILTLLMLIAAGCISFASTSPPTPTTQPKATATSTYTQQPTPSRPTPTRPMPTSTPTPELAPTPTRPMPTPTPMPEPTPAPTPLPTPTPVNPETTVTIGSAELSVGSSSLVPLTARRITDPKGLAAFEIVVKYDPQGVRVNEVQAPKTFKGLEESQEGGTLVSRIRPERGEVYLIAFHTDVPGPTGDVELAQLSITGLKAGVWPLEVRLDVLANTDGEPIPAAAMSAVVTVR